MSQVGPIVFTFLFLKRDINVRIISNFSDRIKNLLLSKKNCVDNEMSPKWYRFVKKLNNLPHFSEWMVFINANI